MMNGELRNPDGGGREERDERDWRDAGLVCPAGLVFLVCLVYLVR